MKKKTKKRAVVRQKESWWFNKPVFIAVIFVAIAAIVTGTESIYKPIAEGFITSEEEVVVTAVEPSTVIIEEIHMDAEMNLLNDLEVELFRREYVFACDKVLELFVCDRMMISAEVLMK
tara:strand:- start:218 stop:574 length:357 start_codon:yes stop_codon:yes gene_type:complete